METDKPNFQQLVQQIQALTSSVPIQIAKAIQSHLHGKNAKYINYKDIIGIPSSGGGVYGGQVVSNAAGSYFPSGMSLTHVGTGIYKITHNLDTTDLALVILPTFTGEAYCICGYNPVDSNNIEVYINNPDSSFAFQNSDFYFIIKVG